MVLGEATGRQEAYAALIFQVHSLVLVTAGVQAG
jgi:hypothetical protein